MNHKKYIDLLNSILQNARNLREAGINLLNKSSSRDKYQTIAQFLLFCSIEECGKFLIVKDLYPNELNNKELKDSGFRNHEAKIKRIIHIQALDFLNLDNRKSDEMAKKIRDALRENSLYVDYERENPVIPGIVNDFALKKTVSLAKNCIEFCKVQLIQFKRNPILR